MFTGDEGVSVAGEIAHATAIFGVTDYFSEELSTGRSPSFISRLTAATFAKHLKTACFLARFSASDHCYLALYKSGLAKVGFYITESTKFKFIKLSYFLSRKL